MGQHCTTRHRDAQNGPVLLGGVLQVGWRVVRQPRGRHPILGRFWQMFRQKPIESWPTFKGDHVPCGVLGKAFVAKFRGQSHSNTTGAQQKSNLLRASILI